MKKLELFERYAELLRRAWLNPSHKPWQQDVCDFEYANRDVLHPYFSKWQESDT